MSQYNQILQHLKSGKTLTQMGALNKFGCMRLGARIHEIKSKGHVINSEMITVDDKTFARYKLVA